MSEPFPPPGTPSRRRPAETETTDPTAPNAFEALYRTPGRPNRAMPPPYQSPLQPPTNAREDDPFSWLYRPEQPSSGAGYSAAIEAGPVAAGSAPGGPGATPSVPQGPPPEPPAPPGPPGQPPQQRRGLTIAMVVVGLLIAAVAGVALAIMLRHTYDPSSSGAPRSAVSAPASTSVSTASASQPSTSQPNAAATGGSVKPAAASSDCQAPAATDAGGQPVDYAPTNLYDGDSNTAWRCDGTGIGHLVTFTFPAGTSLHQVGVINGYAKVDPSSGSERYPEYRRITRVTWTFAGGQSVSQTLVDGTRNLQVQPVGSRSAGRLTLRIDATTKPGSSDPTRDAVLISEVGFR